MAAGSIQMVIDQGEDFTADIIWTDALDAPVNVVHPCRLDIKSKTGATLISLETNPDLPIDEIPEIGLSSELGTLQLHIPRSVTSAFVPGQYIYDLFVTADDGNTYAGPQLIRLIAGTCNIAKRVTVV